MGLLKLIPKATFANGLYFATCPFCGGHFVFTDNEFVCYTCGKNGDTADYLAIKNSVSHTTAAWQLNRSSYEIILQVLNDAALYFQSRLKPNSSYIKKRALTPETIAEFQVGWADGRLRDYLLKKGYSEELLQRAGLIKGNGKDVFYSRLMFPIKNSKGQIIGFGGRRVKDDAFSYAPKYINSPETPVFSKREHLFGINNLKNNEPVYLVEGFMDVISLQQAGINAVAALGTAVGPRHAQLLKSLGVNQVILSLDGDEAGKNNALKALKYLESDFKILVLNGYNDCKDPDEYIKKFGSDKFKELQKLTPEQYKAALGVNPIEFL